MRSLSLWVATVFVMGVVLFPPTAQFEPSEPPNKRSVRWFGWDHPSESREKPPQPPVIKVQNEQRVKVLERRIRNLINALEDTKRELDAIKACPTAKSAGRFAPPN